MEITPDGLEFNSENIDVWRQFLQTQTGKRLLPKLAELTPILLSEGDINKILIRSGEVRGVQLAIQGLLSLSVHQPDNSKINDTNYPAPENDAAWDDGKKLTSE